MWCSNIDHYKLELLFEIVQYIEIDKFNVTQTNKDEENIYH